MYFLCITRILFIFVSWGQFHETCNLQAGPLYLCTSQIEASTSPPGNPPGI